MKFIGATFGSDIDDGAGVPSEFRRDVRCLHPELGNGVQRGYGQRIVVDFLTADLHAVDQDYGGVVALARLGSGLREVTG